MAYDYPTTQRDVGTLGSCRSNAAGSAQGRHNPGGMANPQSAETPAHAPTSPTPATTTRTARGSRVPRALKPENETDPKRREILVRAERAIAELRQYDATRHELEKQRTNRKAMLLGRHFLAVMERDQGFAKATISALDKALTDKTERELFGLAPT